MSYKKGHTKTGGRKKGTRNKVTTDMFNEFLATLEEVEKEKKITFFKKIILWGFSDKQVGIALLKKMIPDMNFNINDFKDSKIEVKFTLVDEKGNKMVKEKQIGQIRT